MRNPYKVLIEKIEKKKDCLEGLGVNGWTILRWTLKKQFERVWTGFIWLRIGTNGGFL
jgi:hypothetical protein